MSTPVDEGQLYGRSVAFPTRIGPDGRFLWSEGAQNIRESIRIILMTEFGERLMLPEFGGGLQSFLFEPNTVATHTLIKDRAERALTQWEPRIQVNALTVEADPNDENAALLSIDYQLVATGTIDQTNLAVQFAT